RLVSLKKDAEHMIDSMSTFTQQMVDEVFSFGELGMQEEETSRYLTGILEKNGFKVTRDIDDIPQANQKPGVGYHDPLITGAPGHGEGHNSGQPLNITAAIAVKTLMEKNH